MESGADEELIVGTATGTADDVGENSESSSPETAESDEQQGAEEERGAFPPESGPTVVDELPYTGAEEQKPELGSDAVQEVVLVFVTDDNFENQFDVSGGETRTAGLAPQFAETPQTEPSAAVPEPTTLALFGLGLAGIPLVRRRRTPA